MGLPSFTSSWERFFCHSNVVANGVSFQSMEKSFVQNTERIVLQQYRPARNLVTMVGYIIAPHESD